MPPVATKDQDLQGLWLRAHGAKAMLIHPGLNPSALAHGHYSTFNFAVMKMNRQDLTGFEPRYGA